ncbi:MAG: DUF308 domain-containing protein [Candidatus Aureabacteria bacterium]|nr:DUF308 domain-containing protein [Candidatus Auribacterota bacterium]
MVVQTEGVSRGLLVFLGIILILAGCAAIGMPMVASLTVELLIGWVLIISGIMQSIYSFSSRKWGKFSMRLLAGILYLIAGMMLVAHPLRGVLTLTFLLGLLFVLEGLCKIIGSIQIRHVLNWKGLFLSGILSLLIGVLIWRQWPSSAVWVIGLLVGINILFRGWALIMLASALPSGGSAQRSAF